MIKILEKLNQVFKSVFDDDNLIICSSTTSSDVDGWDSLAHIRLIVAIEKEFVMRFSVSEISNLQNVGDMIELISKKANDQ